MGIMRRAAKRLLGRSGSPSRAATPTPSSPLSPAENRAADADLLASLECGAQELVERVEAGEDLLLLDVRTPGEVSGGVIPGAVHIPLSELERRWEEVRDADEVVCYCAAGQRSATAARLLRERGVFNATSLEGGLDAWRTVGGRLVPPG